jgi:branched-chain amino acid aminotransferase
MDFPCSHSFIKNELKCIFQIISGDFLMSMADRDGVIWSDGKMVPWRNATTHVLTHTLHYGMGVFEGVRAYQTNQGTAIFRLLEHTDRLFNSAHIFMMKIPYDKATLMEAQLEVVKQNGLESCYIRPIVFYGSEDMGISAKKLSVHVAIAAWPWGTYLGTDSLEKGIRVKTSSFSRHHVNVNMCRAKSVTTYANSMLAHQEVIQDGYDEALLLDVSGYVAEGSGENIFIIKHNRLYTPDMTSCLEGITRASIIELAGEIGIPVIEKRITRDEVYCADEAFFTGTAAEVTPIRELDNRIIGNGSRGSITTKLQTMFFDCARGKSNNHVNWLTYV